MSDEEALTRFMEHPDTARQVFDALLDDCMTDAVTAATNKAVAFVMSERTTYGNELR
jgi:hypothetical protein